MNTTNLFVELLVIGVGAALWVLLVVLSVFGYQWIPIQQDVSWLALGPLLSISYLLGIIIDRIADMLFEIFWGNKLRGDWFPEKINYYNARRRILLASERLSDMLEYSRSRLRICRGWTFNAVMFAICLNIFVWTQLAWWHLATVTSIFGTIAMLLLALASWYAWKRLSLSEYRRIREQAEFLVDS